jgi:tetratricopeptide (TPR) repeat protein
MGKASSVRAALALLVAIGTVASAAPKARDRKPAEPATPKKAEAPPPAPKPPGPDDPAALALLDKIAKGDAAARKAAVDELDKLAPKVVDGLGTFLARKHETDLEGRRKVLETIKAQVPDKAGHFTTPQRKSAKEEKADDDLDWLTELGSVDAATPGLGEVIADDAAIRALALTNDVTAAGILFDTAFGDETIIYRDELGRYLRKMEPHCIPALMKESQARDYDRKRYATYQLERLDRQEPGKALGAAAGDEALTVIVLQTFETTHHREAVHAVWTKVNADSIRVRAAARKAWMAYITGPAPPPAPKKKLQLPGGKLTKKEKPLWLTYRELADNELRKAANELLHEDLPLEDPTLDDRDDDNHRRSKTVKVNLEELTKRLYDFFDGERAKQEGAQWAAAGTLASKGDLAGATAQLDRMLAQNPDRAERAAMANVYFKWGKELESKQKWADAAAAYSKAQGLDPKGTNANEALAGHHFTLGKALEAQGKDGGPDFRRAIALRPDYAPAQAAAAHADSGGRPTWILYCAVTALAAALGLFAAAMVRRRA